MSEFSREWLALREPFDVATRSRELARRFAAAVEPGGLIVDLGAGTGANARFLAPYFDQRVRWHLVDADPALLSEASRQAPAATVDTPRLDLSRDLETAISKADAVTASALLDLVSRPWIDRLVAALADRRVPALFALSVDGRHALDPTDPEDSRILAAFARHQLGDKGFGRALGPRAVAVIAEGLRARGAVVEVAPSDWRIGPSDTAMLRALLDGIAAAVTEAERASAAAIAAWRSRRDAQIAAAELRAVVGHQDVLALWR